MARKFLVPTPGFSDPASGYKTLNAGSTTPTWTTPASGTRAFDAASEWTGPELLPQIPQTSQALDSLSWNEIAQLSAAAAQDPTDFLFMTNASHKLEKNITMNGISGVTQVKARIIGVGQDVDESGNKIGITFQLCDGLAYNQPTAMRMNSSNVASGGWETCEIRKTNLPKIEAALPEELRSCLKTIKKKIYIPNRSSVILKETTDKLVLLSQTEVFGDNQDPNTTQTPSLKGEGEWYQWYRNHNTNNDRIIHQANGLAYDWWLRSAWPSNYTPSYFGSVSSSGAYGGTLAGLSCLPCACFAV